jgi:hypothetical protein
VAIGDDYDSNNDSFTPGGDNKGIDMGTYATPEESILHKADDFISPTAATQVGTRLVKNFNAKDREGGVMGMLVCGINKNVFGFLLVLDSIWRAFADAGIKLAFHVIDKEIKRIYDAEEAQLPSQSCTIGESCTASTFYYQKDIVFDSSIIDESWKSVHFTGILTFVRGMSPLFCYAIAAVALASNVDFICTTAQTAKVLKETLPQDDMFTTFGRLNAKKNTTKRILGFIQFRYLLILTMHHSLPLNSFVHCMFILIVHRNWTQDMRHGMFLNLLSKVKDKTEEFFITKCVNGSWARPVNWSKADNQAVGFFDGTRVPCLPYLGHEDDDEQQRKWVKDNLLMMATILRRAVYQLSGMFLKC